MDFLNFYFVNKGFINKINSIISTLTLTINNYKKV